MLRKGVVYIKKVSITVQYEDEKLDALNYNLEKSNRNLESELVEKIQSIYEEVVPESTREYLDYKHKKEQKSSKPRPNRKKETNKPNENQTQQ